jgi:hypothetical protein
MNSIDLPDGNLYKLYSSFSRECHLGGRIIIYPTATSYLITSGEKIFHIPIMILSHLTESGSRIMMISGIDLSVQDVTRQNVLPRKVYMTINEKGLYCVAPEHWLVREGIIAFILQLNLEFDRLFSLLTARGNIAVIYKDVTGKRVRIPVVRPKQIALAHVPAIITRAPAMRSKLIASPHTSTPIPTYANVGFKKGLIYRFKAESDTKQKGNMGYPIP